jgi:hypothetical protein
MARVYVTTNSGFTLIYAIDKPVGTGCPNQRDDVLLVQFFIKVVAEAPGPKKAQYQPAGKGPLKCDGQWGPISQAYLNQYIVANSASNPASPLTADGRVDPVVGGRLSGSRTGHLYTIISLNGTYAAVRGRPALADITTDPLFPADLAPSIKVG